jgi:HAD superfamily hydrolase (TIGR01490 family)
MVLAFFDLDKTLLCVNSVSVWMRDEWRQGRLGKWQMLKLLSGLIRYQLGITNIEKDIHAGIMRLKGKSDALVCEQITQFYHAQIKHLYRPGALEALNKHREQGHRTVLLTSSFHPLAQLVTEELHLDDCLSTRLEIDEKGFYTGKSSGPLCYGSGKLIFAQKHANLLNISLSDCFFYSDSITDLPVFQKVGLPVVVNPDFRLKKLARSEKWPIVDWGVAENVKNKTRQITRRN